MKENENDTWFGEGKMNFSSAAKITSLSLLVWFLSVLTKTVVDSYPATAISLHDASRSWGALFIPELMLVANAAFRIDKSPFWKNVLVTAFLSIISALVMSLGLR
jgi:hypothetical protein